MYTPEQYAQLALQMSEATQEVKNKQTVINMLFKQQKELLALLKEHDITPPKSFRQEMPF